MYHDYLYARISEDEVGKERGVTRQLRNCEAFSAAKGGHVVAQFSDNDISALRGAVRPGFDQLMAAVTATNPERIPRRIVVQHTSRLWRNRTERAYGIDTLGRHKVIVLPIDGPELNLTTAAGRMVAGMLGEVDTGESETKSERIIDAARERAREGRGNGAVLYGWKRIYQYDARGKVIGFEDVVDDRQAAIVREIVTRVLAGESLIAITANLNDRQVPAPGAGHRRKRALGQAGDGSLWSKTSVKKIAMRSANVGLRIYHRGRDTEQLMPAAWPPLIGNSDHDRVVALLTHPDRAVERPGSRQHLLTWGVGECGECGGHLRVAQRGSSGRRQPTYVCEARGCVGRNEAAVDRWVGTVMVALLSRPDAVQFLDGEAGSAAEALQRAAQYRARMDRAALEFAEGALEASQLKLITANLKPLVAAAEAEAAAVRTSPFVEFAAGLVGEHAAGRWEELSITQRRAVMKAFRVRVIVDRTGRTGPGFDPDSVRVVPGSG